MAIILEAGDRIVWQTPPRAGVVVTFEPLDGQPGFTIVLDDSTMPDVPLWVPANEIRREGT